MIKDQNFHILSYDIEKKHKGLMFTYKLVKYANRFGATTGVVADMTISPLRSIGKGLILVVVMDGLNRVAGKIIGLLCKSLQWSKSGGRIDETFDSQATSRNLSTSNLGWPCTISVHFRTQETRIASVSEL